MIGLFSILTVIRRTRTEEEAGRRELLGATVVGRHAGLAAALVMTFGADMVFGSTWPALAAGVGLAAAPRPACRLDSGVRRARPAVERFH